MDKLVKKVDLLWETKSVYREQRPEKGLQEVKKALLHSTFKFSSMYHTLGLYVFALNCLKQVLRARSGIVFSKFPC